jgi:hypothetical protein
VNTYTPYNRITGIFLPQKITCKDIHLAVNIPDMHSCLVGSYDYLSQRVDVDTNEVIDYIPEQPSVQHEWNPEIKRWVYTPSALEVCLKNRQASYPSLNDLADALYWQSKGDNSKLNSYFEKCDKVKKDFPKPV